MYNVMSGGFITGCIVSAKNGTKSGILVRAVLIHVIWTQPCFDQAGIGFGAFGAAYVESRRSRVISSDCLLTVLISYGAFLAVRFLLVLTIGQRVEKETPTPPVSTSFLISY